MCAVAVHAKIKVIRLVSLCQIGTHIYTHTYIHTQHTNRNIHRLTPHGKALIPKMKIIRVALNSSVSLAWQSHKMNSTGYCLWLLLLVFLLCISHSSGVLYLVMVYPTFQYVHNKKKVYGKVDTFVAGERSGG